MIFNLQVLLAYVKAHFPVVPGASSALAFASAVSSPIPHTHSPFPCLSHTYHCIRCSLNRCTGDLILTGTPAGVSKLAAGDRVEAFILSAPDDASTGQAVLSEGHWVVQ